MQTYIIKLTDLATTIDQLFFNVNTIGELPHSVVAGMGHRVIEIIIVLD